MASPMILKIDVDVIRKALPATSRLQVLSLLELPKLVYLLIFLILFLILIIDWNFSQSVFWIIQSDSRNMRSVLILHPYRLISGEWARRSSLDHITGKLIHKNSMGTISVFSESGHEPNRIAPYWQILENLSRNFFEILISGAWAGPIFGKLIH